MEYSGICDIGKKREVNQDAIFMNSFADAGLFVVADGMGGHSNGEYASKCIVSQMNEWWMQFRTSTFRNDFSGLMFSLQQRVEEINRSIFKKYNQSEICGSTICVLFIYKNQFGILTVGDSRVYQYAGRNFKQLSVDDVWENQVGLSALERRLKWKTHNGKLINAVGTKENITCRMLTDKYETGMVFLLCSDGLYKFCDDKQIKHWMKKSRKVKDLNEICESLRDVVYKNGAGDNMSVILVR